MFEKIHRLQFLGLTGKDPSPEKDPHYSVRPLYQLVKESNLRPIAKVGNLSDDEASNGWYDFRGVWVRMPDKPCKRGQETEMLTDAETG